jgi:transporter family protein
MWFIFALLSAITAALASIFAKVGLENVNSNLATAIRTIVILFMTWGIVYVSGAYKQIPLISERNWWFIIFSGLATGVSWLCYFKALQLGQTSNVVAIDKFSLVLTIILAFFILHEAISIKMIIGCILITIGTLMMI